MARRLLEKFMDDNRIYSFEGQRGVMNLCKIALALGYEDPMQYGQLGDGAVIGNLLEFLRDNSGACEALVEWIQKREGLWANTLSDLVDCDEDEE